MQDPSVQLRIILDDHIPRQTADAHRAASHAAREHAARLALAESTDGRVVALDPKHRLP